MIEILKIIFQSLKVIVFDFIVKGEVKEWLDIDFIIYKEKDNTFLNHITEVLLPLNKKVGMDILIYISERFYMLTKKALFYVGNY